MKRVDDFSMKASRWYWTFVEKTARVLSKVTHWLSVKLLAFSAWCDVWSINANQLKK